MAEDRPLEIASIDKPGVHRVAVGLYRQVSSTGAKSWRYRFMIDGKTRHMGLDVVRDVTLAQARKRLMNSE